MNIAGYNEHVEIMKNLNLYSQTTSEQEPFKENFEKIRQEAKEEGVTMSTAKDFLNSLSKDDLHTLQKYSSLAEEIEVNNLSQEGAYNLLLDHYEKFDFNQDGMIEDGNVKGWESIPFDMPNTEKKALVESLNQMGEKESLMAMMFISFPDSLKMNNEGSLEPHNSKVKNFQNIMDLFSKILDPEPMGYSSPEIKAVASKFMTIFEENYAKQKELEANHQVSNETSANIMKAKLS